MTQSAFFVKPAVRLADAESNVRRIKREMGLLRVWWFQMGMALRSRLSRVVTAAVIFSTASLLGCHLLVASDIPSRILFQPRQLGLMIVAQCGAWGVLLLGWLHGLIASR